MRLEKLLALSPLSKALVVLGLFLAGGTLGYALLQGWNILDALYMTMITITTVGYEEVHPLNLPGRIFTILLLILSMGAVAYLAATFGRVVVEGELLRALGRKRLEKKIQNLVDHYIICGYGRIGSSICRELALNNVPMVVIEQNPEKILSVDMEGYLYVRGNATDDDAIKAAGIERARGMVATVASDADNLYITLSARQMNPNLYILARSSEEAVERKLRAAGANLVVSPYTLGARRMVNAILRPKVMDFLEIALSHKTKTELGMLQLDEMLVKRVDKLDSQVLKDSGVRSKLGLMVVAIQKSGSSMTFNPSPNTVIEPGDTLICLGEGANLQKLEELVAS